MSDVYDFEELLSHMTDKEKRMLEVFIASLAEKEDTSCNR